MSNRLRSRFEKIGMSAAGLFLAITALNACSEDIPESEPDPNITSITLESGARVREEPVVLDDQENGMTNRLVVIGDDEITIATPEGAQVATDSNGDWYGIDIGLFPPDFYNSFKRDKDGTVWVSGKKADAQSDTPTTPLE